MVNSKHREEKKLREAQYGFLQQGEIYKDVISLTEEETWKRDILLANKGRAKK